MEHAMSFPISSGLAAVALASALTVAQAQTTQEQDHTAHHHAGQAMGPAQGHAMGAQGHQMMMGGDGAGMMPMMPMMQPRHVEGRIAFLRTELKITDAQSQQWSGFADVLRANAKAMMTMHVQMHVQMRGEMMHDDASAPEQAEHEIKMLSSRLEALKATAAAETALYAVLSDERKKVADELLAPPMGRM
jgi:hypothetical protein